MEKYITFSTPIKKKCDDGKTITYKLRFIDSLFMPTSLSELVDNMSGNSNGIECKSCTESNRCKRKRVYPYEYMDSWGKFDETSLPPKEAFYSNLNLEDVFENFRNMCLEIYKLDPTYFVSAPGLAWQACLKKTRVSLELLTDYDRLLMVEKEIRGGICQATHRYAKAKNKYMKNYDKNNESSYKAFRCK